MRENSCISRNANRSIDRCNGCVNTRAGISLAATVVNRDRFLRRIPRKARPQISEELETRQWRPSRECYFRQKMEEYNRPRPAWPAGGWQHSEAPLTGVRITIETPPLPETTNNQPRPYF